MTFSLSQLSTNLVNDGNAIYMTAQSYSGAMGIAVSASIISFTQKLQKGVALGTKQGLELNFFILFLIAVIILILYFVTPKNTLRS